MGQDWMKGASAPPPDPPNEPLTLYWSHLSRLEVLHHEIPHLLSPTDQQELEPEGSNEALRLSGHEACVL